MYCLFDEFLFHEIYAEDKEDYSDYTDPDYAQKQCCLSAEVQESVDSAEN